jgi:hypothetical protein
MFLFASISVLALLCVTFAALLCCVLRKHVSMLGEGRLYVPLSS